MIKSGDIKVVGNTGSLKDYPNYDILEISTEGTSYENWLGRAYIIQNKKTGNYVGFFDTYDFEFDPGRESIANFKTTAVAIAALFSTFASPYYFYYW